MKKRRFTTAVTTVFVLTAFAWQAQAAETSGGENKGLLQRLLEPVRKILPGQEKVSGAKAQPAAAPASPAKKTPAPAKDMTEKDMAETINRTLSRDEEVLRVIPGLKKEKDAMCAEFYTYNGAKIDDMPKEKLRQLMNRVRNEDVALRSARTARQLQSIQQAQRMAQTAQRQPVVTQPPKAPPSPPRVYSPPQPPKTPQPPPSPPRR